MKDILLRFKDLLIKLISVKGVIFIIATILLFTGTVKTWLWFSAGILLVSSRMFEKIAMRFIGCKYHESGIDVSNKFDNGSDS